MIDVTNPKIRVALQGLRLITAVLLSLLLFGCAEPTNHSRAAFVLMDISDSYAAERDQARRLTNYLLSQLDTGDSLAVGFIDNSSFTERNIVAQVTFDERPSVASQQKRVFQRRVTGFMENFQTPSYHSDITGGVLLARDYLEQVDAGEKHLFLLSDLHEDVPPRLERDMKLNLSDVQVVAINVKRQRSDNENPQEYEQRLASWEKRVEENGGRWAMVNNMERLEKRGVLR
ncbi:hypothetical protein DES49_1820 [Halospina denitrificans]|uniref:VWFA domain-containing protein n=1 Tax=Halospina denitrificans TaxID=332522 RepID=A0A4V3EQF9_9GAMM|nr:VWA domain-containing protein [Halospina denitrificans]TDT41718.1 hypothetical protein DES49_1820 [Halospina denitrificans]